MAQSIQDIQIEEYLLNKHDLDLISKYTNYGQVESALARPVEELKEELSALSKPKHLGGKQTTESQNLRVLFGQNQQDTLIQPLPKVLSTN